MKYQVNDVVEIRFQRSSVVVLFRIEQTVSDGWAVGKQYVGGNLSLSQWWNLNNPDLITIIPKTDADWMLTVMKGYYA